MGDRLQCWARGDEIEALLKPILKSLRTATLLFGDSGIGKTTLAREVKNRLSGCSDLLVGFHEASPAEPDPLLHALDDLLHQVYTLDNAADQISIACTNLKSQLSLVGLKDFLLKAQGAMVESSGLEVFAKTAVTAFGWVAEKATALDARVPAAFLPQLSSDVFRDLLKVLSTALPKKTFVFIVDNLSASAESITAEVRGFGSADTIQAFLSQGFPTSRQVHFLFSWKLTQGTASAFGALSKILQQYGGRIVPLQPIQDKNALAEWLRDEFAWFRALPQEQQEGVVRLTGGLPEIVVGWREAGISPYNREGLVEIAKQIRDRRYVDLSEALQAAPADERKLLYSLALVPHAMPLPSIADMLECPAESCWPPLPAWTARSLLRRLDSPEADSPPTFDFYHEKKREVALGCLPETFSDKGISLERRVYNFFLGNFTFATASHPFSPLYLDDALELLSRSNFVTATPGETHLLKVMLAMVWTSGVPRAAQDEAWMLPETWPRSLQAHFLDLWLATSFGGAAHVLRGVERWLAARGSTKTSSTHALTEANVLPNLIARLGDLQRTDLAEAVLRELRELLRESPKLDTIAEQLAMGLFNMMVGYDKAGQMDKVEALLGELGILRESFPQHAPIAEGLAKGLVNMMVGYDEAGQMDKVEALLGELRGLLVEWSQLRGEPPFDRLWRELCEP